MSKNNFLYEDYDSDLRMGRKKAPLPDYVADNLNPRFGLRKYQHEAFERFIHYLKEYPGKPTPIHLLFNMATGSGKTLIMAGLILYLYEQGYRNFLFFVNTKNIIGKTRDNFLNSRSPKYLFNSNLNFDGRVVHIREVNNFEEADSGNINICFTTTQKLHHDMSVLEKENCLTFDDFDNKKVVLLSDEAQHMQSATRQGILHAETESATWESTVEKIFGKNIENILLEFTATVDYLNLNVVDKYYPKVIYCYDLKQFRNDGYSKDVHILQSDLEDEQRMLQAVIISQYRQKIAGEYRIRLKPVILFKALKTIKESENNEEKFEKLIGSLRESDIEKIGKKSTVDLLQCALKFFSENGGFGLLAQTLKENFAPKYCLNVNKEEDLETQQIILNSLENNDNQIRAIFAVQKLNEGWDVLNLFDIVRLYNTRDARQNKPGRTTIAEAQLIGRGARYFPFAYEDEGRDMRKFDKCLEHPLRILEELHYHSFNNVEYISELKKALVEEGIFDESEISVQLTLKEEFKKQKFYKEGIVYLNEKEKKMDSKPDSLVDLKGMQIGFEYDIATGFGEVVSVFVENKLQHSKKSGVSSTDMLVEEIESHIVRKALAKNDFYNFDNLKKYFRKIKSISDFMGSDYLGEFSIKFRGKKEDLGNLTNLDKLGALIGLLNQIAVQLKKNKIGHEGTIQFKPYKIKDKFFDKMIKVNGPPEKIGGDKEFVRDKKWYVFNEHYGTKEERGLVRAIVSKMDEFCKEYADVYLVRNERHVKIYNFEDGRGFEPDYFLFLRKKKGQVISYQLFIEPKGTIFMHQDAWKEKFLLEIKEEHEAIYLGEANEFKIIGLPFYNTDAQKHDAFFKALNNAVEESENSDVSDSDKKAGVDSPS